MKSILDFLFQKEIIVPILILFISIFIIRLGKIILKRFFIRGRTEFEKKKRKTILELTYKVFEFFVIAIAIMMILDIYGVDTKGILASLGIAGVVLGLALQDTLQDLMSGIYIILDNFYVMGDIIRIKDFQGEVIDVSLKSTKVRAANGETLSFPNRNVNEVINLSQANAGLFIKIPTAYEEDTEKVEKVISKIIELSKKLPNVYEESKYLGIDSFEDSSINYLIVIYCKSSEQWNIKRAVLKIIKEEYEKENVKIPYRQIEVHNGKNI